MYILAEAVKEATSWPDVAMTAIPAIAMVVVLWIIFR